MKTNHTLLVTLVCVVFGHTMTAQHTCNETLSLFAENVKTKRFSEAKPQLGYLRKNCASTNYVIYAYGEIVLDNELKTSKDSKKAALALIKLYEDRMVYFPEKTPKGIFLPKIGTLMIDHKVGTLLEQYNVFDEAFQTDATNFKNPKALYQYFELYHRLYKTTHGKILLEEMVDKYELIQEKLILLKEHSTKNKAAITTFLNNMNILFRKEATCETLIPMYEEKLENHKNNLPWMRKAASTLEKKGCEDNTLFIKLITTIDIQEPTANTKLYLYKIHERQGNLAKANTYFEEYLALETDKSKKLTALNNAGNKAARSGQKSKARSYYLRALKIAPSSGYTYLSLARLYGSSANECGTDEFTKRATYWKAAEMARKAASVDASVKSEADHLLATYMQSAPSKTDIFDLGYKGGEKIIMKCWIGGIVTVPKL